MPTPVSFEPTRRASTSRRMVLGIVFAVLTAWTVAAENESRPFVSPVFGDHMVLQRDQPNRIWGWTTAGLEVRVEIAGIVSSGRAASDGRWEVAFTPPPVGGPYTLSVAGPQSVQLQNLLVGDVWLCSGQSNMAFGLAGALNAEEEIRQADHPQIRLYRVGQTVAYERRTIPNGAWQVCAPAAFERGGGGFSAVAYFFARKVQQETGVPIGLIQAAVGGSPIESWMGPEILEQHGGFAPALAEIERLRARGGPQYGNYVMHWFDEFDPGIRNLSWAAPEFDDSTWKKVTIPGGFAELGVPETPAVAWFRREVELPDPLPPGTARLQLGVVEKMDTTHLNGQWVGASSWVENPRNYAIRDGVLRPGRNLVAIRVLKTRPAGGFQSPAERLRIVLGDGTVVPLAGEWRGAISVDARPPHPMPLGYENYPTMPVVLYHGMLAPLAPLAVRGALWYQGEANFTRAFQYRSLLPAMIRDWRALFANDTMPFYAVSLPAYMERKSAPGDDMWAELREAQARAARTVPHTGLAVTIDTGDAEDIHPREKQPVGERLALLALRHTYGRDVVAHGPSFAGLETMPGALRVRFEHADGGLVVRGDKLGEFAIAGADQKWHWAEARIDGDTVIVSSPAVPSPVAVRYAWQANPLATLFNGAGLPAEPFRSDDWRLSTQR